MQVLGTEPAHGDVISRVRQYVREPEVASKTSHDGNASASRPREAIACHYSARRQRRYPAESGRSRLHLAGAMAPDRAS